MNAIFIFNQLIAFVKNVERGQSSAYKIPLTFFRQRKLNQNFAYKYNLYYLFFFIYSYIRAEAEIVLIIHTNLSN